MVDKNKLIVPLAFLALAASAITGVVGIAHADSTTTTTSASTTTHDHGTPPAAVGTVSSVDGDMITLVDKKNSVTYTVDATNATITKSMKPTTADTKPTMTTITVSQVAVGDMLAVQGTVSGNNITATNIRDGMFGGGAGGMRRGMGVEGTVTAVNGSTVTVTGKDGKSYTVDASNATVGKFETIPVSSIQIGDSIGVQGTVSGTSVTAKSIMDGMPTPQDPQGAPTTSS